MPQVKLWRVNEDQQLSCPFSGVFPFNSFVGAISNYMECTNIREQNYKFIMYRLNECKMNTR